MKGKKLVALLLAFVMVLMTACGDNAEESSSTEESSTVTSEAESSEDVVASSEESEESEASEESEETSEEAGGDVLRGEGAGLNGPIIVEVTANQDEITEVAVIEHEESPGISDPAIEQMPSKIVDNQSLKVDTVAGATYTSNGILEAVENALTEGGIDTAAFMTEATGEEEGEGETIELNYDVVVIGGGGAGLAAAVGALQEDASVIVLEKMPTVGGSTIMAGGQYNAVDDVRQHAIEMRTDVFDSVHSYYEEEAKNDLHQELMDTLKAQVEEYTAAGSTYIFDSPELHALQTYRGGDYVADLEMVYTLTKGAEESIGWLESLGVEYQDEVATVTGALWPRTHQFVKPLVTGPIDAYVEFIESKGDQAEIMFETRAYELIMEGDAVVGVKAKQGNNEVVVMANNGVVIATGGFARNEELVAEYDTHWGELEVLGSTNSVSATGDGIEMAQAVNANLVGMEWIQLLPVGDPVTGGMQGNISINAANQLFINNEGNRFVAEDARRDVLTQGLMEQPDKVMWILHDAHEYTDETVKNDFNEEIGQLVEAGTVQTSDTIEGLAEAIGVDPEALVATVDTYNQAVAGEIEDPMGKTLLQDPFDQPPYYASKRVPTIHHTMGGIQITPLGQVVDADGNIIQGLYAAGEVTGGIHGANRLGGNAVPDTVVFGRIAGESAALKK